MKALLTIAAAVLVAAPAQAGPYLRHYKGIDAALMCIEKQEFNERMLQQFELQDLQMKLRPCNLANARTCSAGPAPVYANSTRPNGMSFPPTRNVMSLPE